MSETATPFEGRTGAMRSSPWLAAENLDGLGDIKCVIEGVFMHTKVRMQDGKEQAKIFTLKFVGKDMELVLNATNRKTLASKFGVDTKQWKGKEIILFVQDGVKCPSGGKCKGIRIK